MAPQDPDSAEAGPGNASTTLISSRTTDQTFTHGEMQAKILRAVRYSLEHVIRPGVASEVALHAISELAIILDYFIEWIGRGTDSVVDAERLDLLTRLGGSLDAGQGLSPDFGDGSNVAGSLAALIARLSASDDFHSLAAAAPDLARVEARLLENQQNGVAASKAEDGRVMPSFEVEVTPALVETYLAQRPTLPGGGQVASITRIPGGYSKDTFIVATKGGYEFVIRRDLPFGCTPASAAEEFDLLDRLAKRGFPVPRPLAAEFDAHFLGQPFLVVEKVRGRSVSAHHLGDATFGRDCALQLAQLLGRLHAIPPIELGIDAPKDPREATRAYINSLHRWWLRTRIHSSPLCELAFAWLDRNAPEHSDRVVLVHGDAGPHNLLRDGGEVTALLDWEFAHAGDPTEDLETSRLWLGGAIDRSEFEATYLASGGVPVNHDAANFYEVWRSLRNVVLSEASWGGFLAGKYPMLKPAVQGVLGRRMFLQPLANTLQRIQW